MKRFQFKLSPLLSFRAYQERLAQQETAGAHKNVAQCRQMIQNLKQEHEQQSEQVHQILEKGTTAIRFLAYCQYLDSVENQIENEKSRKVQLKKILDEKITKLKKKSVEKKVMELYRDKLKDQYQKEFQKEQQKELDEISSLKQARKVAHENS